MIPIGNATDIKISPLFPTKYIPAPIKRAPIIIVNILIENLKAFLAAECFKIMFSCRSQAGRNIIILYFFCSSKSRKAVFFHKNHKVNPAFRAFSRNYPAFVIEYFYEYINERPCDPAL